MTALVERDDALARAVRLGERAATSHGGLLVWEGEAGVGKTSLLRACERYAVEHGCEPAFATGHPIEAALAFGVVRQLLEPLVARRPAAERARLASGPGRVALAMLEGATVAGASGAVELELVHATYRLVAELADPRRPLLLAVDDLQWADRSSAMLLVYLAQRLATLPVVLLASVRRGEQAEAPDLVERLLASHRRRVVPVEPLSGAACAELVHRRFADAGEAFCREAARVTGGNPLLLGELLDAVAGRGAGADDRTAEHLEQLSSVSLQRSTRLRLEPTGPDGRLLAEAVAVLEPGAPLRRAAALADLPAPRAAAAADALVRVGVLRAADPPAFGHPLVMSAVLATIPDAQRGLRHRRAAALALEEGAAPEQVAAHLIRTSPADDPGVVAPLRAAARDARSRGAAEPAVRYLERALAEPPATGDRAVVLAELAEAELLAGRPGAMEHLGEALEAAVDPETETRVLIRTGDLLFQNGRYDEAAAVFDRALEHQEDGASTAELRFRLRACRLAMEALLPGGRVDEGLTDLSDLADVTAGSGDGEAPGRFLQVHLALVSVMAATDHERTRRLVLAALGDGAMVREQGLGLDLMVALACLVWCDGFEECDAEVARALEVADGQAAHLARAHLLFGRSWIRYWSGRLDDAVADARAAIEPWQGGWSGQVNFARFWCASALLELDRLDEAAEVLAAPDPLGQEAEQIGAAAIDVARGRLAAARGDLAGAAQHLDRAASVAAGLPFLANPAVLPWRSEAALARLALGEVEAAAELVAQEVRLARSYGAPRALGVALRAQGLVVGGEAGIALLQEAATVLAGSPAHLERVRARIDLGAALRRAGRRGEAREALRDGLAEATGLGAVRLRERARSELVAAGGRPRREAVSGPASLTPSERRVCALAAAGRSNPQIAAELFLSRRTVEFHLRGAFRKLGVSSRDQLGPALED